MSCQREAVAYARFVESNPHLAFVGLNVADEPERARRFVAEHGWTWPSIHDPERERARKLGADYQPHVVVIGPEGDVVSRFEGAGTEADWQALAERVGARG